MTVIKMEKFILTQCMSSLWYCGCIYGSRNIKLKGYMRNVSTMIGIKHLPTLTKELRVYIKTVKLLWFLVSVDIKY